MIKYYKLFDLLNRKGMKKTDLDLSSKTIAKLSKGANLNTDVIDKICLQLNCQPGDIMECIEDTSWLDLLTDENLNLLWSRYDIYHDVISIDEFKECLVKCINKKVKGVLEYDENKLINLIKQMY